MKVNYQAKPVCWVESNEPIDVAVHHKHGNHRAFPGVIVDLHRDKAKDIGVKDVLPENGFLAEMLRPAHTGQRGKKKRRLMYLTFWTSGTFSTVMRRTLTATS